MPIVKMGSHAATAPPPVQVTTPPATYNYSIVGAVAPAVKVGARPGGQQPTPISITVQPAPPAPAPVVEVTNLIAMPDRGPGRWARFTAWLKKTFTKTEEVLQNDY